MINPTPDDIVNEARAIIGEENEVNVPSGEFWRAAFNPSVLRKIVRLRNELLLSCRSSERVALLAIMLGALHGPKNKKNPSYLSNQCPRTYAPKPNYAIKFWKEHDLIAPKVDVIELIKTRAERYYLSGSPKVPYTITKGDSRKASPYSRLHTTQMAELIVTSPPYPGMTTYYTDQWLRNWFLGGPDCVDYDKNSGIRSRREADFIADLREVWQRTAENSTGTATLICRFGILPSYKASVRKIIVSSFRHTPWVVKKIKSAGSASKGRRIADTFMRADSSSPNEEIDILCIKR
jgi:hypothetical protein